MNRVIRSEIIIEWSLSFDYLLDDAQLQEADLSWFKAAAVCRAHIFSHFETGWIFSTELFESASPSSTKLSAGNE